MKASHRRVLESCTQYQPSNDQPDQSGHSPFPKSAVTPSQTQRPTSTHDEEVQSFLSKYNAPKIAIRPSSDYFPRTKRLQKATSIPTTFSIAPFPSIASTDDFPKAEFGARNPVVRCEKCRSYVNPFTVFQDGGQEFVCNMCNDSNNTPRFYFVPTDKNGVRNDVNQRAELHNGCFDIKAGTEYMSRPAMPPIYYFVIDVSQEAVENGSIESVAHTLNEFVTNDWLWGDTRTKVGFIAYDTNVHLISLNKNLKRPTVTTLTDIEHLAKLPVFENLLVNLSESKDAVLNLLRALPKMYAQTTDNGTNLFSAIRVSASILKRSGGRIYAFQSNSNLVREPGLNKSGIDQRDRAHLLCPNSTKFAELTPDMQQAFVSCNLFIFGEDYKDVITIADLPRYLNGDVHYYSNNVERSSRFYYDFRNSMAKEFTWETVFRVRASVGWKITNKYGNYSVKSSGDLLSLPNLDGYKSLVYEVELEAEVAPSDVLYIQSALLYTTAKGERRIRIINYGIQLTDDLSDMRHHVDSQAIACSLMKKSLNSMYEASSLCQIRDELTTKASQIFLELAKTKFREEDLTEQNIVFLMSILGFLKHPLFLENSWGISTKIDALNALRVKLNMLNVDELMLYFVPYLFSVHTLVEENTSYHDETSGFVFPGLLNLSMNSLNSNGVYLMDAGDTLYMLVGSQTESNVLNSLFGINSINQVETLTEDLMYQNMEDPLTIKMSTLLTELRSRKTDNYAYLHIIKEGEASDVEYDFYGKLLEDKLDLPNSYNVSFTDFISNLTKLRRI